MANNGQDNLIPLNERTKEEQREIARQGGIASGEARKEKATMRKTLELWLNMKNKETGNLYIDDITKGIIEGAMSGKAENYKVIAQMRNELEPEEKVGTPVVNINVVDNTDLEKALYEDED